MLNRLLLAFGIGMVSVTAVAADLTVTDATVTKVQAYETPDDSVNVWIHLNGNSHIGPNPVNSNATCELWTNDKVVHSTALTALISGKKVTVNYVDRGEGTYWCKVRSFAVGSN